MREQIPIDKRMKDYEKLYSTKLLPRVPALARLDGRCFSGFTNGLRKPFDMEFQICMWKTLQDLVEESSAVCGYAQSDEISLVFSDEKSIFFEGKVQKMCSVLAGFASARFNRYTTTSSNPVLSQKGRQYRSPVFDCRVWSVPDRQEAVNAILWRELDCTRNAIMSLGQKFYSHTQLHKKNTSQIQDMLMTECGINFNDMPSFYKRGVYCRAKKYLKTPSNCAVVVDGGGYAVRHKREWETLPRLASIENRIEVIFESADPILREQ